MDSQTDISFAMETLTNLFYYEKEFIHMNT